MLSWLNPTARALPMYASQRRSPSDHATLGSGWLPALTGQDWLPAGFQRKVSALRRRIPLSQALPVASRAHNQYTAECTFGKEFMHHKRHEAQARAAAAREPKAEQLAARRAKADQLAARPVGASEPEERDVVPWLRQLGFNAREARSAAALCSDIPDAPLEQRVRVALKYLHRRGAGGGQGGVIAAPGAP